MKQITLLLVILLGSFTSNAQITVTDADFATASDTVLVSLAPITTVVDLSITGAAQTWDFSSLTSSSQVIDSFIPVTSTGLVYSIFFANVGFNSNRASVAQPGADIVGIPNLSVTNVNNFYYANSTQYIQTGIGAELNGIQTPIAFNNKDVIYSFPMNFGNVDSSDSDYGLSIPGLGTYLARQKRVNHVDGWGTLITPYGTFNVLRQMSELSGTDSLYLDTLGFGFTLPRPVTREYKWIGNNQDIPLLQINTQVVGPSETVTAVRYRDHDSVATGIETAGSNGDWQLYPNPSSGLARLKCVSKSGGPVTITVTGLNGIIYGTVKADRGDFNQGVLMSDLFHNISSGTYLVDLQDADNHHLMRWINLK